MSSVVEGFVGGIGDIVSGVGKAFKSVLKSDVGKAALLGALIYTGYVAFQPGGIFAAAEGGVLGAEGIAGTGLMEGLGSQAELALTADAAAGAASSGSVLPNVAPESASLGATQGAASGATQGAASVNAAPITADIGGYGGPTSQIVSGGDSSPGIIGQAMNWVGKQPDIVKYGLIQSGAGALQNAFTPDALDVANEQARLQRENLEWRQRFLAPNYNVAGINVGRPRPGAILRDSYGNPVYPNQSGLIQSSMTS